MPIDASLSDMPWLTQSGDAGKNLAEGAAVGAHIAQFRAQNASLAQRAQEFQAEQNLKLAQLPLQMTLQKQQADKGALQIEQLLKAKNDDIEGEKAFTGLQSVVSDGLAAKKPLVEIRSDVLNYATKNQAVFLSDKWKPFSDQIETLTKEADFVKARADANAARMEAAKGAGLRSLPTGVKIDRLLQQAQSDLADAQDPETGDPSLIPHFQQQVESLQAQKQMESDKLKVQQGKVTNEAERNKAIQARTAATNARTLELGNRLNRGDLALMNQKIKVIQDQPNSKMDFAAKMKAIDDIHAEFESKTKGYSTPGGNAPASGAPAAAAPSNATQFRLGGTYRKPDGSRYIYKGGDANDAASWQPAP